MRPELVILDCDGVLVRSEHANVAYYNIMFRHFGIPEVMDEDGERRGLLHTLSTPQVIDRFFPAGLREEARGFASGLEYADVLGLVEPEPGWAEVLGEIRKRAAVCVATNRGRSAPGVIEAAGLKPHVDRIFTVHDVKNPKPAPDLLFLAASSFGVSPGRAVYVGDSGLDRAAALSAGVPFVGFRIDGDYRIENPCELENIC